MHLENIVNFYFILILNQQTSLGWLKKEKKNKFSRAMLVTFFYKYTSTILYKFFLKNTQFVVCSTNCLIARKTQNLH